MKKVIWEFDSWAKFLSETWAKFCRCFVHQHGRLITWVKTKNRVMFLFTAWPKQISDLKPTGEEIFLQTKWTYSKSSIQQGLAIELWFTASQKVTCHMSIRKEVINLPGRRFFNININVALQSRKYRVFQLLSIRGSTGSFSYWESHMRASDFVKLTSKILALGLVNSHKLLFYHSKIGEETRKQGLSVRVSMSGSYQGKFDFR